MGNQLTWIWIISRLTQRMDTRYWISGNEMIDNAFFCRGFHISTTRKSHRRNTSYGSDSGARYEYLICAFKSYHLVCRSPRNSQTRITLPSGVYLELLQLGYFAIFNGLVVFLYVFVTLLTFLQLSTRHFASCFFAHIFTSTFSSDI